MCVGETRLKCVCVGETGLKCVICRDWTDPTLSETVD